MYISSFIQRSTLATGVLTLISVSTLSGSAEAVSIVNGGFETNLDGWTIVEQANSNGGVFHTNGGISPISGNSILNPSEGAGYVVTDQAGPGSYAIFQDISLESGMEHLLSFDWFAQSWSDPEFFDAGSLDRNIVPNQHFRVDVVSTDFTDWFAPDSSAGVLANIIPPLAEDAPVSDWNSTTFDLSAWAGQDVRLAFRQVDNRLFFNAGIDNVNIESQKIPEPGTVVGLLAVGLGGTVLRRRQEKSNNS